MISGSPALRYPPSFHNSESLKNIILPATIPGAAGPGTEFVMHLIKALTRVTTSQEWSFKKQWRSPVYYVGDIYQDDIQNREREKWKV